MFIFTIENLFLAMDHYPKMFRAHVALHHPFNRGKESKSSYVNRESWGIKITFSISQMGGNWGPYCKQSWCFGLCNFPDRKHFRASPTQSSSFAMCAFHSINPPPPLSFTYSALKEPWCHHLECRQQKLIVFWSSWQIPGTDVPTRLITERQAKSHHVTKFGPKARPFLFFNAMMSWDLQKWVIMGCHHLPVEGDPLLREK